MNELKVQDYNGLKVIDSRDVANMVERSHNELMKSIRLYTGYLTEGNFAHIDNLMRGISPTLISPFKVSKKDGCKHV